MLTPWIEAAAFKPLEPSYDMTTLDIEQVWGAASGDSLLSNASAFPAAWLYSSLPSVHLASHPFFGAFEAEVMPRAIKYQGGQLSHGILQRYGLFAGYTPFESETNKGTMMVGGGVASDMHSLDRHDGYLIFIYDHRFTVSENLKWGIGIEYRWLLGRWDRQPYLLFDLDWRITPTTRLHAAWSVIELKQYLIPRLALCAGARYAISYFGLDNQARSIFETVSLTAGTDVSFTANWLIRLRFDKYLMKNETINMPATGPIKSSDPLGMAVRMELVYGK
jgi:hypothetical protein